MIPASRWSLLPRQKKIAIAIGAAMLLTDFVLNISFQLSGWFASIPAPTEIFAAQDEPNVAFKTTAAFFAPASVQSSGRFPGRPSGHAAIPATTPAVLSQRERDLCHLRRASSIPLDGELRLQSSEHFEGGRVYWLKSSNCPDELYSIAMFDRDGRLERTINCLDTNLTELSLSVGKTVSNRPVAVTLANGAKSHSSRSFATAGDGMFLVKCPDTGLTLTRDGRFHQTADLLVNGEGCAAWTRKDGGRAIHFASDEAIDDEGCSQTSRECLEILEPDRQDPASFNFKTKNSLSILNERAVRAASRTSVHEGFTADLDTPSRGLTGVGDWESTSPTKFPDNCP